MAETTETFAEGDAVWIADDYAGSPHAAVITSTWDDGRVYAESTARVGPTDSRHTQWAIPPVLVADMVSRREPAI